MILESGTNVSISRHASITVPEDHPNNADRDDVVVEIRAAWRWNGTAWVLDGFGRSGVIRRRLKGGGLGKRQRRSWMSNVQGKFQDLLQEATPTTVVSVTETTAE